MELGRIADPVPERDPLPVADDQRAHESVVGGERGVTGHGHPSRVAQDAGAGERGVDGLDHGFVDREVDVVALADERAVPQGYEREIGAHGGRDFERRLPGGQERRATGNPAHRELARERVHDRVRRLEGGVRTGCSERGRRDHDNPRVVVSDRGDVDAVASGLEPDVCVPEQRAQLLGAVAHDRSLVGVASGRKRIERLGGAFDADDVGAQVGQQPGAGPRRRVGGVDDTETGEREPDVAVIAHDDRPSPRAEPLAPRARRATYPAVAWCAKV